MEMCVYKRYINATGCLSTVFIECLLFQFPPSKNEWLKIGNEFEEKWQFLNCLGAVKSKQIIPPKGSGSFFWNYRGSNSIVLLATANVDYEFIYCDIETDGCISNVEVIQNKIL
jgi:hypothetical protein